MGEVARRLVAPLDVCGVRKLGVLGQEELAPDVVDRIAAHEALELERRERAYRSGRPPQPIEGRTVIVIDDGLATGATMCVAVRALRVKAPATIVVAVPVAAPTTCRALRQEADLVVCPLTPDPFCAVGLWYRDFAQVTGREVSDLLARSPLASPLDG